MVEEIEEPAGLVNATVPAEPVRESKVSILGEEVRAVSRPADSPVEAEGHD